MTQATQRIIPSIPKPQPSEKPVPPLQNGDHLSLAEFERRFDATAGLKKAELIQGIVYRSPPVSYAAHGVPQGVLAVLLGTYAFSTPGVKLSDNSSVRLDDENMPQPDLFLLIEPGAGGQAKIDADDYVSAAPELVAEISASTASYDLHEKLAVYRSNGVKEYIVWRTYDSEFDYFALKDGQYERLAPADDGSLRSTIFPGLWFQPAHLELDPAKALAHLQQGLASPEHAAFVASLKAKLGS